jgi:hypothetical protein
MIKYNKCPGCKTEQSIKGSATNRGELQIKKGTTFKFNCNRCGKMATVHVNDIKAKVDRHIIVASSVFAVIASLLTIYYISILGGIALFFLPITFWRQQENAVSTFNRYKVKR